MLRLTEDNMIYSDGVACVQAYWAYSMDLSQSERDDMRSLILGCKYRHTVASREAFSAHRLCRDPFGTTRPGLILLRVLYKAVPVDFENSIVARFGRLPVRNRSDEYSALFPNTVGPPVFEMDMSRVRLYHLRYPLLKVTPSTCRKRQEVVVPAPQETLSPTTSPTMSATDIGSEASTLAPSTPTRNEDLGHKTPDLNTALNNN
ncbi:hypothetical protein THARTR1_00270 [Trichoderma harzianum]|uniref:Uncharacterized protein n=1 Tax=Trichoderma harzianum TaxID=5544 RepID=A0A2K0UR40_TRIHA|nr:hypothetical protein THARTR1_00270 [Trichoderma harzianum]